MQVAFHYRFRVSQVRFDSVPVENLRICYSNAVAVAVAAAAAAAERFEYLIIFRFFRAGLANSEWFVVVVEFLSAIFVPLELPSAEEIILL